MIKVFISQPMKDKTDEEILAEREKAIRSIQKKFAKDGEDVTIIDSFFQGAPEKATPLWFLGESIKCLSEADIAYFIDGWEEARGCRIERLCAIEYGITVIEDSTSNDVMQAAMSDKNK